MANISKIAVGGTEYDIAGVGLIATIETTLTASKTYNVGDQFIYNGLLYKVTQTIASGTTITIGSNCQLAPVVADQLSKINSNLANIRNETKSGYGSVTIRAGQSDETNITFNTPFPTGTSYAVTIAQSGSGQPAAYVYNNIILGTKERTVSGFKVVGSSSRTTDVTVNFMWIAHKFTV